MKEAGIEEAIKLAREKFEGMVDKDGNPAVLHLLAVGNAGKTDVEKITGYLHDVVEDTDVSFEDLIEMGFSDEVIAALRLCTHNPSTSYEEYVDMIINSGNRTAINVKLNDLQHNHARGMKSLEAAIAAGDEDKIKMMQRITSKHESALKKFQDRGLF